MKTLSVLVALTLSLVAVPTLADCDVGSRAVAEADAGEGKAHGDDCIVVQAGDSFEAECHPAPSNPNRMTWFEAEAELDGGLGCEVITTEDGNYVPQCDSWAFPVESEACQGFVLQYQESDREMAYEACMAITIRK